MRKLLPLFLLMTVLGTGSVYAQKVAVKTNMLYWATTTPNLGFEFGLGKRTTLELSGGYNPWTLNKDENRKFKHFVVAPEFRYWLCEGFQGHFFGIHAGYGEYNISGLGLPLSFSSTLDNRYQGWGAGAGIAYGYSWIIGKRWNLEATVGIGYVYTEFDKYECRTCGRFKGFDSKHYFGPTKLGISFVYMIK